MPERLSLHLEARIHRHAPGVTLPVGKATPARGNVDGRYFGPVQVLLNRDIGRGADGADIGQHPVILDQLARLLDRLGRAEGVVERDQRDLAAVDSA